MSQEGIRCSGTYDESVGCTDAVEAVVECLKLSVDGAIEDEFHILLNILCRKLNNISH